MADDRPDVPPVALPSLPRFSPAPGESNRAFAAFCVYRELGPQRRYATVVKKVGRSLRTIKRWAHDFDWHGRIQTCADRQAARAVALETTRHHADLLDVAARDQAFRDRQHALAETLLSVAGRYLAGLEHGDLDQMSFTDACKALALASHLGQPAARRATDDVAAPARNLRDQIAALLDQACGEAPARPSPQNGPDLPPKHPNSNVTPS